MTQTRDDVLAAARVAFQGSDFATIISALDLYGAKPYERERERVQLAIISLCGRNKDKLLQLVRDAKTDYRDILAWQQLSPLTEAEGMSF